MENPSFFDDQEDNAKDNGSPKGVCYLELNDKKISTNGLNVGRRRSNAFSFSGSGDSEDNEVLGDHKKESLIATTLQVLKHKDFVNEFRSKRDIDLFVSDSRVLLDCNELDLEAIFDKMLSVRLVSLLHVLSDVLIKY